MYKTGKDYKLAMAMGLSFTSLTLCADHSLVPTMEKALWFLTIVSILLYIASILLN